MNRAMKPSLFVRLHRVFSLVLSAWIGLMAVTGFVLVFRSDLQRLTRPELYRHGQGSDIGPSGAFEAVALAFPDRIVGEVKLPRHNGGVSVENDGDAFVAWLTVAWVLVFLTGIYIWYWPRIRRRWTDGVRVRRGRGTFKFNLDLHRAVGMVTLAPLMVVALTGIDFGFEDQVETLWERFTPAGENHIGDPPGEITSAEPADRDRPC